MEAIEIKFTKNKSRFKSLHYEDQVRLMKEYLKHGSLPFECMNHSQKMDFKWMASCYKYIPKGDKLMKNVITKKKKVFDNEHEYLQYLTDKTHSKAECHLKTQMISWLFTQI